ncbi:PREDICTED: UBP1-associated protein 2C-like [Tarenaya hassleriana]|uniref:UBP1-associated protein 2C-like n=1 Tax=Tarenaya hassleriana TaxID=28532 RepID=UPI00053C26D7|nr:PREDICTED: UBP1-associated protein 2C-like [Tarenaya hassleriana]
MEEAKKRKMDETGDGETSQEELRSLLEPIEKSQLVDLLSRIGSQYPSIAEEIKSMASADPVHRKLFVRGLAWNTSSETLCATFRAHGEIEEGAVIYDKTTGKSRGYGFITYKHIESAQNALKAGGKMIDGRLAVCNLACEGLSGTNSISDLSQRKLFIGGLSPEVTSEMLLSFFGRCGEIEEGSVAYDKDTNESRGFGFVTFRTVEAAKKALDDPHKILGGRAIVVKLAETHKGKQVQQARVLTGLIPTMPMAVAGGPYPQQAGHLSHSPAGYSYPQALVGGGPYSSYPSPPATNAHAVAPPGYYHRSHAHAGGGPYAPVVAKEPIGRPQQQQQATGVGLLSYYMSKQ